MFCTASVIVLSAAIAPGEAMMLIAKAMWASARSWGALQSRVEKERSHEVEPQAGDD